MTSETLFRMLLAALLVGGIAARTCFQWRAERRGGPMQTRADPRGFWLGVLCAAPLVLIPLIAFLFNPAWISWSYLRLGTGWRWAGAAIAILGFAGVLWTFAHLGENLSRRLGARATGRLVTSGPYRWVRHPLYAFALLSWAGVALMTASWLMLLGVAAAVGVIRHRIPAEEAALLERFGDAYREYQRRSGALLPRRPASRR